MVYFCFVYLYFFPIMKIVSEKFGGFTLIYLICNRKGALCALVRHIVPCLIGKIEALCSFLQAENLGNFQSLQRMFGDGPCVTRVL